MPFDQPLTRGQNDIDIVVSADGIQRAYTLTVINGGN